MYSESQSGGPPCGQTNKPEYLWVKSNYFQQENTAQSMHDFARDVLVFHARLALKKN